LFQISISFSDGPVLQGLQAIAEGAMIVQYDYTPAPLPGTLLFLGSGLLSLVGLRVRTKG
jgi:uncharacterized membrane protein